MYLARRDPGVMVTANSHVILQNTINQSGLLDKYTSTQRVKCALVSTVTYVSGILVLIRITLNLCTSLSLINNNVHVFFFAIETPKLPVEGCVRSKQVHSGQLAVSYQPLSV